MGGSWRALLDGDDAAAARAAIDGVVAALDDVALPSGWIAEGHAGAALLHAELARAGDEAAGDRAVDALERGLDQLDGNAPPWLLVGTTGLFWTMAELDDLIDPDDEALCHMDGLIGGVLDAGPWRHEYELIGGLISLGLYGLGRGAAGAPLVGRTVAHLAELAERTEHGVTWRSPDRLLAPEERAANPTYINLGLAHGVVGVICFLAEASAAGTPGAAALLADAIAWLRPLDTGDAASRFPRWLGEGLIPRHQIDGWCYGDQAVAAALVRAGQVLGEETWLEHGRQVAHAVIGRPMPNERDPGFCHGSLGRAHMFNRLGQALGDQALLDEARRWYRHTIGLRRSDAGVAGFVADRVDDPASPLHAGLLVGALGVAAGLQAAISPVEPRWDRAFLVALPPGG
jgi:lantibiotic biosynthesis protein